MSVKPYPSDAPQPEPKAQWPGHRATGATEAAADQAALLALIAKVEATRFDPDHPPPEEPWVFKLAGEEIAHPGNIITIAAATKAGKSSVVAAMLASMMGTGGGDYLGFAGRNPDGKAVLHFDTEQSKGDHHAMMKRALRRAGINAPPKWFASYPLIGYDPADRRRVIFEMARKAAANGGLHSVLIDGCADLIFDVNDIPEACGLVTDLHQLADSTGAVIVTTLHHNPGGEKTRGHLGSQIERKSESVLLLRKEKGIVTISCQPARRAEVTGDQAPRFARDKEADMHVTVQSKAASKDDQKRADLTDLAAEIFADKKQFRWFELKDAIQLARGGSKNTIEGKIGDMKRLGVIRSAGLGLYMKGGQ